MTSSTEPRTPSARVSLRSEIALLPGAFQQREIARVNDAVVRLAMLEGEFPWHYHDEDELFLCWDGELRLELEGRDAVHMEAGDVFVVPSGLRHRPVADQPAHVLLVERPETKQYGS